MILCPYTVTVVLDRNYGERMAEVFASGPVWTIDSPANVAFSQQYWKAHPDATHLEGITVFRSKDGLTPEESLLYQLDTIDLHHGRYSAEPPYTVLNVIGCEATIALQSALQAVGFDSFQHTPQGFCAQRPLATAESL